MIAAFVLLLCCLGMQAQPLFEHHTYQVWNTGNGLPQDSVRQFLQTRDGYLWMATDGGIVRFDGFDFVTFDRRNTPALQSDLVNALFEEPSGTLWIATSNGLLRMADRQFRRYSTVNGLPSDSILSTYQGLRGQICAMTSAGAACLVASKFVAAPDPSAGPSASNRKRSDLHVGTADGSVWRVTDAGLTVSKDGRTMPVSLPQGFSGSDILALYGDREGNVWVGSENAGVAIVRSPPFTTLGKKDGLAGDQVRSLYEDKQHDLWFGTSSGLTRLHNGVFTTVGQRADAGKQRLASDEIIALAGTNANDLWVGTPDGLSHIQGTSITTLTASDGLPDDNIRSLLEARDGSLWIGTTHGLAHLKMPARGIAITSANIHTYTTAQGLASNVVGALLEDIDGSVWVGTRAGLSHVRRETIASYGSGAKPAIITALGKDAGGTLWVGTAEGGLYGVAARPQLPDTVYSILDDGRGQVWFGSSEGIYRLSMSALHALVEKPGRTQPVIIHYDVSDGLRINDCGSGGHPEALRSSDGHLFFATSKGVSIVNVNPPLLRQLVPPVVLETVTVDDSVNDALPDATGASHDGLHVSAGHDRLAFHYAGFNFASPSKIKYRYQLDHFDRAWIDAGTRRTAYYTNIPPGRYRFRVQASINNGEWSEHAAELALVIAPHYYQTWWFYTLCALMLALIAWQLYLYRLRQVELRFNAVLAERGRIAREIHDTLAQDIVAISVQLDLVSRLMTLSIDKAREQLIATRSLVRKSLAEARSSIWDLRSSSSDGAVEQDLPTRLRATARQIVGDVPIQLTLDVTGTYRRAPRALEDELLRIGQEAVTNAIRHAAAKTIKIKLAYQAHGVDLSVRDDGQGFTPSAEKSGPAGHYGIRGMHERAERANAHLTIVSRPGFGTTIRAQAALP